MYRKYKVTPIIYLLIGAFFIACSSGQQNIEKRVDAYYQIYNQHENWNDFIAFYGEEIVLEDMINGDRIVGKEALKNFFDWGNPDFKSLDANYLVVSEKIIQKNKAVIKGYYTSFQWKETKFEAMHFTTILTFDASGKIIKQVDWINYPKTLINYNNRKNSNEWIQ